MSERQAAVKLTLDDSQYVVSIKKAGDASEHAAQKGHHAMGLFGKSVHGAEHAVHGLHRSLETVTELVTGLAAGFSMEEALKTTIELDAKFKHLAYRISNATGELVSSHEIQEKIEETAAAAGQKTIAMADAFEELVKKTGDAHFAEEALGAIGTTATATGENLQSLTDLAEQLHTKFGVGAEEMGNVLAQAFDAATKGGPQLNELAEVAGNMGAELLQAGMGGQRGLDFMLGALTKTHHEFGSLGKQVKGVKQLLLGLGDEGKLKDLAKHLGINPASLIKEKDLMGRLRKVLSFGKRGVEALKGSMHESEEQKTLKILFLDPFEEALQKAGEAGKKGKGAIDAALDDLDDNIQHMGESALKAADLQKEAEERKKDPQMQLQKALEELEHAFAQPEIISAINDMSLYLPKAAGVLADFVKFAVSHPLAAGAAVVGGKASMGFGSTFAQELLKAGMKGGTSMAAQIEQASFAGSMTIRNAMIGAGGIAAVAIAGAIAKEFLDEKADEDAKTTGNLAAATASAGGMGNNIEREKAQLETLRKRVAEAKESRGGFGGVVEDVLSGAGGAITGTTGAATLKDEQIREAMRLVGEKQAHIAELEKARGGGGGAAPASGESDKGIVIDSKSHREGGAAFAQAMAKHVLKVEVVGGHGHLSGTSGGGSRGPRSPAPAAPGGGH